VKLRNDVGTIPANASLSSGEPTTTPLVRIEPGVNLKTDSVPSRSVDGVTGLLHAKFSDVLLVEAQRAEGEIKWRERTALVAVALAQARGLAIAEPITLGEKELTSRAIADEQTHDAVAKLIDEVILDEESVLGASFETDRGAVSAREQRKILVELRRRR
jgi:hypothetical protein